MTLAATIDWTTLAWALGGPEIVVLLILLAIPAGIAALVFIIARASRSSAPPPAARTTEDRIRELDSLRDQKLISDEEHEERRKAILEQV